MNTKLYVTMMTIALAAAALGMIGSGIGTHIQQANASGCQSFIDASGLTKQNCSSENSHGKAFNGNIHSR
jgi:hypothetical protein